MPLSKPNLEFDGLDRRQPRRNLGLALRNKYSRIGILPLFDLRLHVSKSHGSLPLLCVRHRVSRLVSGAGLEMHPNKSRPTTRHKERMWRARMLYLALGQLKARSDKINLAAWEYKEILSFWPRKA